MKYYEHPGRRVIRMRAMRPLNVQDEPERFAWRPGEVADPLREARIQEHIARVRADPRWEGADEVGHGGRQGYMPTVEMTAFCEQLHRRGYSVLAIAAYAGISIGVVRQIVDCDEIT